MRKVMIAAAVVLFSSGVASANFSPAPSTSAKPGCFDNCMKTCSANKCSTICGRRCS